MAATTGPSAVLCNWACNTRYEDLPEAVRKEARTVLYDQVGCMIAAATLESCQPVVNLVRKLGAQGNCSIVGHPVRTTVTYAALANGTIGHGDEVDSTGQHGTGHFAAAIVPTALSVGQYAGTSGRELCRAIALGAEIAGRVVSLLGKYDTRPQFAAAAGHTLGTAITAGTLLGLNAVQMEHALGLAAGGACGLNSHHEEELHQIKSLELGKAAEAGTLAALLAAEGFRGPKEPLTIEWGYFDAFLGIPEAGHEVVERLGENYMMREIAYKRYSVGGPDQTPLYAFLQLIKANQLTADDIEQIEVSLARNAHRTVTVDRHPSVYMTTILSMAAVYGDLTFAHVHEARYRDDPRVKAFQERARIFLLPRPGPASRSQRMEMGLTVRTRNGKVLRQELRFPVMTEDEIQNKFRNLAGLRLDSGKVMELEGKLKAIEGDKNIAALVGSLEIPYKTA
jgi:2-methylcitrate dehydratase PrpD